MILKRLQAHESDRPHEASSIVADRFGPPNAADEPVRLDFTHRLRFTRGAFHPDNSIVRDMLTLDPESPRRVIAFVDDGIFKVDDRIVQRVETYAHHHADAFTLAGPVRPVIGGERCKNDSAVLDSILRAIHDERICRRSYVMVVGGGAVLDVVGFAAATAHRGVRLVRLPSTTVALADSGVGVKTGVNLFGKKNYLGSFAAPWAVINDFELLHTLSDIDWRCGLAEAVKVGLVKDRRLYDLIVHHADALAARDEDVAEEIWRRSAELHLHHITRGGDPFELTRARPLDFGHWAAHKLEQLTTFELRHGEAVAIGMAIDILYSVRVGMIESDQATGILDLLRRLGFDLSHPAARNVDELLSGLEEFREHLGGQLTITLLHGPGHAVDVHAIDEAQMRAAIHALTGCAD